jgi:hypothetical protein
MSIMNMPPIPYLARIPGLDLNAVEFCYADATVWHGFDPGLFTLASADPQTFCPSNGPSNVLQVTLATNFKVARFADNSHTSMLRELESAIESARIDLGDGAPSELPVKLKVHDSLLVPLCKWSMLITGNYRCIEANGVRSIREAVHSDIATSQDIYDWVQGLCRLLGASNADLVPFQRYADAAFRLTEPSSIARAVASGATEIERVDLLIQSIASSKGMRHDMVDATVELVGSWLLRSRQVSALMAAPG